MDPLWNNIFRKKRDEDSLAYFLNNLPMFAELTDEEVDRVIAAIHDFYAQA